MNRSANLKLGILGSTRGTSLSAMIEAIQHKRLNAEIKIVISNKHQAGILERAEAYHLPTIFIDPNHLSREEYDAKLTACFAAHQVDVIVLIGYMRILSKQFIETWHHKVINVHPSLLPAFSGLMDEKVHQAVLDSHAKESGCSVHIVTEEVDSGPILVQKKCSVLSHDTVTSLKTRVQTLESEALIEALRIFKNE